MFKKCIVFILMILGFTIYCLNAYADDNNVLAFKKSDKEHKSLSSAIGISVNSEGEIALGFRDNYINVYDGNGRFINGYSFKTSGSYVFGYDTKDNIMIFSVRAGRCYFFNKDAKLLEYRGFSNSTEEDRYYSSLKGNRKVSINGNLYELSELFGYTKLIKTGANENKTIIYDIGWVYAVKILIGVFKVLFIIIVLVTIKKAIKQLG